MKHPSPIDDDARFKGPLRHYHRSGTGERRTWDEWVEGKDAKPGIAVKCLKIAGIVVMLLALGGIVAGLFIVLR